MQFDLKKLNPGSWFTMEGGGEVCLRICNADSLQDIRKKTTKTKEEYKKVDGVLQRVVSTITDTDKENGLVWDYCIVDWKNFYDADLVEIPCTTENKMLLMGGSVIFSKFVLDSLNKLREEMGLRDEESEKNY